MADDTKTKLEGLKTKIINALEELVTLKITTIVGQVTIKPDGCIDNLDFSKEHNIIMTKINLLDGDVMTVIDKAFVTGEYQTLKEFHSSREKEAQNIVKQNIEAIERLLKFVNDHIQG